MQEQCSTCYYMYDPRDEQPRLMTIYLVSARQDEESVMKRSIRTCLLSSFSPGAPPLTLETLCFPADMETPMQRALSSSWSRQELEMCKWGFGRKVNERKTRVHSYFWLCVQDFMMLSMETEGEKKFWIQFSHRKLSNLHNKHFWISHCCHVMDVHTAVMYSSSFNIDSVSCLAVHGNQPCGGGMCCGWKGIHAVIIFLMLLTKTAFNRTQ